MRGLAGSDRIDSFMDAIGKATDAETVVYFTGGASAVLRGWRSATIDIDLSVVPERDEILRALPSIKEDLEVNVELASPAQFIPELPGWRERSPFVARRGSVTFRHYDFYSQALSKIERGHAQDLIDVASMITDGLVEPARLPEMFDAIKPVLYRFPAIDPDSFRRAVERVVEDAR